MTEAGIKNKGRASGVLVVDDETQPRQEIALLLASAGFEVSQAADAHEAEERLAAAMPGIVLIDNDMPNVNGFQLCRRLRKEYGAGVYMILRTSKEELFSREFAADEGADDFLIEPVSDKEILARVETGRKMKQLQEKLAETSESLAILEVTDSLTGAFNKRRTDSELGREMERSRRYGHPVSLVMVDLDGFRRLNSEMGRAAGDRALEEIARVLRLSMRATDVVGRYGGEEFAVILPETTRDMAFGAAEKIRKVIEQTAIAVGDRSVHVTVSAGVATFDGNNFESAEGFVAASIDALAKAKAAGRNQCVAAE